MLGGCLLLTVVSAAVGIKVTIPQPQYEVARGDNVTLPCNFEPENPDYPLIVVSWSTLADRPGIKGTPVATFFDPPGTLDVSPQFEKRITMRKDVEERRVDLILTDVTLLENKVFECEVKIPGDDTGTLAATTRLVVLVAPSKPVCKIQGKTEYGQNINLTCLSEEGSPTPQYSWQRYNVQNQPTPLPPRTTDKKGILSLYNVSMETSGYFICTSQNKIRSATCNMTLTVLPPSMNIGSTAGIIGGCVAALLVLVIIIYCCCRRKKEESKEYPEGIPEETPFRDVESKPGEGEYRDDKRSNPSDTMGGRSPRGQIESEDRPEERSERNYDRRNDYDERRERYDDRRSDYDDRRSDYNDRRSDFNDRRSDFNDRRSDFNDRRSDYDDRRSDFNDRRSDFNDRRSDYEDSRSKYDDRRDRDPDRRDRYDSDRRSDYDDRASDYNDRRDRYDRREGDDRRDRGTDRRDDY